MQTSPPIAPSPHWLTRWRLPLSRLTDSVFWIVFCFYLSGGIRFGSVHLSYLGDALRISIGLALVCLVSGVDLRMTSFIGAFSELNDSLLQKRRPRTLGGWFVGIAAFYLVVLYFLAPLMRHWSFGTWRWDLGALEQILWRGTYGYGFSSTAIVDSPNAMDFLRQQHLSLWLIPLSYVYRVFPRTETLIVLQSAALLGCAVPLWKISRRLLPKEIPPIIPVLFLWLDANFHRVNLWDVHENAFIVLPALWAFYFFIEERFFLTALMTFCVALFKEDAWVVAGAMGGFFFFQRRRYAWAGLCLLVGFAVFFYYASHFTVSSIPLSVRYSYLGSDMDEAKQTVLTRPWVFIIQLFSRNNLHFLWQTLMTGGGLWVLGGSALLLPAPTFFEVALSTDPNMPFIANHYITPMLASLLFCVVWGLRRVDRRIKNRRHLILLVSAALIVAVTRIETSEAIRVRDILNGPEWSQRQCRLELIAHIPAGVAVYASEPFVTHVSRRPILLFYSKDRKMLPQSWAIVPDADPLPDGSQLMESSCGFKLVRN